QSAPAPSSGTTFDATLPDRGDDEWFFTGFTYYTLEQTEDAEFNAGFSMYVAAWPFQQTYPGDTYQSGLPSTWMTSQAVDLSGRELYSTIEGGLGWWRDTRFATEAPKFIMGGVSLDFAEWANGPGAGAGTAPVDHRDWSTPQGKYGVAQLSPYVLWAPDGLNLAQDSTRGLFGYGYHPLPIIDPQPATPEQPFTIGDNSWTLFLETENFSGPVSFFIPNFFAKPVEEDLSLEGLFFDTSGSDVGRAVGLETQVIPAAHATVDGVSYARITTMQYPATDDTSSVILHRISSYANDALGDDVDRWFAGGDPATGAFADTATIVHPFTGDRAGDDAWLTIIVEGIDEDEEYLIDIDALATIDRSDPTTFRYRWNLDLVERSGDVFVLPDYYRLEDGPNGPSWQPVSAGDVPAESGLHDHEFSQLGVRNDQEPYTTPTDPDSLWRTPGPAAGPFEVELGDGSVITYEWYRFIDQPAIQWWDFTDAELEVMQGRVERIHAAWTPNDTYIAPPTTGDLAALDPAVLVTPPPGLEIGYVPIVTRQEAAG
ncbi:MAG: hypothetical protein AAGC53_14840, partial [Actinomycetota bacterium]